MGSQAVLKLARAIDSILWCFRIDVRVSNGQEMMIVTTLVMRRTPPSSNLHNTATSHKSSKAVTKCPRAFERVTETSDMLFEALAVLLRRTSASVPGVCYPLVFHFRLRLNTGHRSTRHIA